MRTIPTCDEGTPALIYDEFPTSGLSCDRGTSNGGLWNPFGNAEDPAHPVTGVIAHVTALHDDGYGVAVVSAGGLGVSDCSDEDGARMCVDAGSGAVIPATTAWLRWTIVGVGDAGAILTLATSLDGSNWVDVTTVDSMNVVPGFGAKTYCPLSTPPMPPIPCSLQVELSDALFVCRSAL